MQIHLAELSERIVVRLPRYVCPRGQVNHRARLPYGRLERGIGYLTLAENELRPGQRDYLMAGRPQQFTEYPAYEAVSTRHCNFGRGHRACQVGRRGSG